MARYIVRTTMYKDAEYLYTFNLKGKDYVRVRWSNQQYPMNMGFPEKTIPMTDVVKFIRCKTKFERWLIKTIKRIFTHQTTNKNEK